jgi:PAS domain-containing protein
MKFYAIARDPNRDKASAEPFESTSGWLALSLGKKREVFPGSRDQFSRRKQVSSDREASKEGQSRRPEASISGRVPRGFRDEAAFILAVDDGCAITDIGASCEPLLGYGPEELIGKPLNSLLCDEFAVIEALALHSGSGVQQILLVIRTKVGDPFTARYCCRRRANGWSGFVAV